MFGSFKVFATVSDLVTVCQRVAMRVILCRLVSMWRGEARVNDNAAIRCQLKDSYI